ncbi:hypothetical protein PJL18_03038 [Paenarthrobacter nicotinovorans]|nr:hypothetical protein [Paenarthrobacter nicotinovorans]
MEEPGWKMMGDKFQPGPFTDVIVGARQRVTREYKLFLEAFPAPFSAGPGGVAGAGTDWPYCPWINHCAVRMTAWSP